MVQANAIDAAFRNGVKKLLFLGSSCIYPRKAPQPISDEALLTSIQEPTNEPYAIAKIAGIKLCESYNRQYGKSHGLDYHSLMPTNLYGLGDNYHPQNILAGEKIPVFNYGKHKRDFTYIDDIVQGVIRVLDRPAPPNPAWSRAKPDPGTSAAPWRVYNISNNNPANSWTTLVPSRKP